MKSIFYTLVFITLPFISFSQDSKNKKVKEFLEVSGAAKMGEQVVSSMIEMFKSSYSDVQIEFWNEFKKEIKSDQLIDLVTPIYAKHYTEQELNELINFYKSPIGQKTVNLLPVITEESMAVGQQWGMDIAGKALQKLTEKGHIKD